MTQVRVARQNVAFFRNMNLGQRRSHSPTSAELIGAFAGAGASTARNVQSNGTVVFDGPRPRALARDVVQRLGPVCGYTDAVMVRPRSWVLALAEELRSELLGPDLEVALFDHRGPLPVAAPWTEPQHGLLTVLRMDGRHAVTAWAHPTGGSAANPVLTALLGVPVTCRGVPTMLRVADKLR